MKRKITILVAPEGTGRLREYKIPRVLPWGLVLGTLVVVGALAAFGGYTFLENRKLAGQQIEMAHLRQKAVQQNLQLYAFADKVRKIEEEMAQLLQSDRKLRSWAGKSSLAATASAPDQGGSETDAYSPGHALQAGTQNLVKNMHLELDRLLADAGYLELSQQDLGEFLEDSKCLVASIPNMWPVEGKITSYFGYRDSPFGKRQQFHRGIDISRSPGTPIVSPAEGVVVDVETNKGYGLILTINHGYGVVTRYAHCAAILVEPGRLIKKGQKIALVGNTGRVTGPHLHYEIILNGVPINPMKFMTAQAPTREQASILASQADEDSLSKLFPTQSRKDRPKVGQKQKKPATAVSAVE